MASSSDDVRHFALAGQKQFYIFGHNISYSLSPTLNNAGFRALNLNNYYQIHDSEGIDEEIEQIVRRSDFGGASVTIPHKLHITKLLDSVSPQAEVIGAINTIVVKESDGRRFLQGDNTDWVGVRRCVEKAGYPDLAFSAALVVGAGGAARAACYAIQMMGFRELIVVNRTLSKAQDMISRFSDLETSAYPTLEEVAVVGKGRIGLIVACVPAVGLGEEIVPSALFSSVKEGVLVEMAYKPQITGMMKVAGQYPGWMVFKGTHVLVEQAYGQFELWTKQKAPVEAMQVAIEANLEAKK
ncbi:hypothetical protein ACHAPJ_006602 [Fusarium lateritium]